MGQLAVDLGGQRTFLHRNDDRPLHLRKRRGLDVDHVMADPGANQRHLIFDDLITAAECLADQREQRAVGRDELIETLAAEMAGAVLEELLAGVVNVKDPKGAIHRDHHRRDDVQDKIGIDLRALELSTQLDGEAFVASLGDQSPEDRAGAFVAMGVPRATSATHRVPGIEIFLVRP